MTCARPWTSSESFRAEGHRPRRAGRQAAGSGASARPVAEGFANPALKVPFIDEVWPELISTKDKPSPVTIKGSNFSSSSFVLFNDQIVRGTVRATTSSRSISRQADQSRRCIPARRRAAGLGRRCIEYVLFHGDDGVAGLTFDAAPSKGRVDRVANLK